jgi:hypothetical protein
MRNTLILAFLIAWPSTAQNDDKSAALRDAAVRGRVDAVEGELVDGAPVDGADKNGRTALMLAAQHGRADVVTLLLSKGANAGARDKAGLTAWGLAMFNPVGKGLHHETLDALPQPPRPRVIVNSGWTPIRLVSSCFMTAAQLAGNIGKLWLDRLVLEQFEKFAVVSGKNLMEIVDSQPRGMNSVFTADGVATPEASDAPVVINIQVQPGSACSPPGDSLNLGIDVRVFRVKDRALLLGKAFGGGIKGLRAQQVDNPAQYVPVYEKWIKGSIEELYWAVAESLYRADL